MPGDDNILPPSNMTVMHDHKPVLYLADGRALVRQAGFTPTPTFRPDRTVTVPRTPKDP